MPNRFCNAIHQWRPELKRILHRQSAAICVPCCSVLFRSSCLAGLAVCGQQRQAAQMPTAHWSWTWASPGRFCCRCKRLGLPRPVQAAVPPRSRMWPCHLRPPLASPLSRGFSSTCFLISRRMPMPLQAKRRLPFRASSACSFVLVSLRICEASCKASKAALAWSLP